MFQASDYLQTMRHITKFHDGCIQCICETYHLTKMEATIVMFLKNNPSFDTAADIAELRALSKSHISQAVESLCQKNLLERIPDQTDRRKIHLSLLPSSTPITQSIEEIQQNFQAEIFDGFSQKELELFSSLNHRIMENIRLSAKHSELKNHSQQ